MDHKHGKRNAVAFIEKRSEDGKQVHVPTCLYCGAQVGMTHLTAESARCEVSMRSDWELRE